MDEEIAFSPDPIAARAHSVMRLLLVADTVKKPDIRAAALAFVESVRLSIPNKLKVEPSEVTRFSSSPKPL